jgi:hypothetical protein
MNISEYNFSKPIQDLFNCNDLSKLHLLLDHEYKELFEVGHDSSTIFHDQFYNKYRAGWPEMEELYESLIRERVSKWYSEPILYQKFPTFRVHLPGNIAVGRFHTDAEFGHPEGEVNYVIPLTDSDATASIWAESFAGIGDYLPLKLRVGELIKFNGNKLSHGNMKNMTEATRVSMDFRVLPMSKYTGAGESVTMKTKFVIGQYYKEL